MSATADALVDTMRDAQALARWARPNNIALEDERVEEAVLAAFDTPGGEFGVPMLRTTDPERPAVPLLDVLVNDTREFRARCDRCHSNGEPQHRLWIPTGASVVELVYCWFCHDVLNDVFPDLVWR